MRSVLAAAALLLAVSPALAQKRASFISGSFVESAAACQRLKEIKSGKPGTSPLASPAVLTATGSREGADSRCHFKSVATMRPGKRWRVVLACVDSGAPFETTAEISKKGKDQLVIFQREIATFWPAEMGRGEPVKDRPGVRVVREQTNQTETWQRCDA